MIKIDEKKCTGCGACVKDCFPKVLVIEDNKAKHISKHCMQCGHCVSICPVGAVSIDDYDMDDVEVIKKYSVKGYDLLHALKSRRSIRNFTNKQIERDILNKLLQVGKYAPTGGNRQELTFIVIEQNIELFKAMIIESLGKQGEEMLANGTAPEIILPYIKIWVDIYRKHKNNIPFDDIIFFGAPTVILIAGDREVDAGIAASLMELSASTFGLGALYSGFITRGCQDVAIKKFVGLNEDKNVLISLVLGYTDLKYIRTAPRKKVDVIWK